jgi:hypothetical protein
VGGHTVNPEDGDRLVSFPRIRTTPKIPQRPEDHLVHELGHHFNLIHMEQRRRG